MEADAPEFSRAPRRVQRGQGRLLCVDVEASTTAYERFGETRRCRAAARRHGAIAPPCGAARYTSIHKRGRLSPTINCEDPGGENRLRLAEGRALVVATRSDGAIPRAASAGGASSDAHRPPRKRATGSAGTLLAPRRGILTGGGPGARGALHTPAADTARSGLVQGLAQAMRTLVVIPAGTGGNLPAVSRSCARSARCRSARVGRRLHRTAPRNRREEAPRCSVRENAVSRGDRRGYRTWRARHECAGSTRDGQHRPRHERARRVDGGADAAVGSRFVAGDGYAPYRYVEPRARVRPALLRR